MLTLREKTEPRPSDAVVFDLLQQLTKIRDGNIGDSNAALKSLAGAVIDIIPYELVEADDREPELPIPQPEPASPVPPVSPTEPTEPVVEP